MLVVIWAHLANLNQNDTHLSLDQHVVETHLKHVEASVRNVELQIGSKLGTDMLTEPRRLWGSQFDKMPAKISSKKSYLPVVLCQCFSLGQSGALVSHIRL